MTFADVVFFVVLVCCAVFILYRAIRKKSWCPDIYGKGSCTVDKKSSRDSNNSE